MLVQQNGKSSVRGGNIKEVHFLPDGDFWQVYSGAVSMTSNTRKLRQQIGVDRTTGTLRPQHSSKFVDLSLNTGASSGYTQTGDLITVPFTEEAYVTIGKASTTEFVNPYDVVLFNGTVTLSPSRDLWFDTQRLPSVRRTVEGDYDTVLSGVGNALGTIWNNWQSDWLGEPITTVEEPTNRTVTSPTPARAQRAATPAPRSVGGNRNSASGANQFNTRFELR